MPTHLLEKNLHKTFRSLHIQIVIINHKPSLSMSEFPCIVIINFNKRLLANVCIALFVCIYLLSKKYVGWCLQGRSNNILFNVQWRLFLEWIDYNLCTTYVNSYVLPTHCEKRKKLNVKLHECDAYEFFLTKKDICRLIRNLWIKTVYKPRLFPLKPYCHNLR